MNKQLQLFLNHNDEVKFTFLLKKMMPDLCILNDNVWRIKPDVRDRIEDCSSGRVYLFKGLIDKLPILKRENGDMEGPISGCVVQVLRPFLKEDVVYSGRIAADFDDDDKAMKNFVSSVWKCTKSLGTIGVLTQDKTINKNYLIGESLSDAIRSNSLHIADRATGIHFRLK